MTRSQVVDLNDEIEEWAEDMYKKFVQKDTEKSFKMSLPFHELQMVIDTKNFFIRNEEANYEKALGCGSSSCYSNNVLFKTNYANTTSSPIEYVLNAQRSTKSTLRFELSCGYVRSGSLGLKISLPGDLAELSGSLGREVSMQGDKEKQMEQELAWSIDTTVKVPAHKTVTARLVVNEFNYSSRFKVRSFFSGFVVARLYKENQKVATLKSGKLAEVFKESRGFEKVPNSPELVMVSEGHCQTTCGVEQFIHIEEAEEQQAMEKAQKEQVE